jgi:hypothetical protein
MASKPEVQSFTQNWNKTVNWAKQQGIPYSAYYPVYQLDTQRMLSGSPLSEAERIRAIQASAGLNYSTALPTDNQSPTDLIGNTKKNAQDIFTGLDPTHLVPNIFDTVKSTITNPGHIIGDLGDALFGGTAGRQTAAKDILKPDNILSWVPGVYDMAQILAVDPDFKTNAGGDALAKTPLTSILDIIPFGRAASEGLGATERGAAVADRIGMTTDEMRKAGIWRVGGKLIKSAPIPKLLQPADHPFLDYATDPDTGLKTPTGVKSTVSINDMWTMYKNKVGAGSEQADITEANLKLSAEGTKQVEKIVGPAMDALSRLSDEDRDTLTHMAQTDFRPLSEKMADSAIPPTVREAYAAAWEWSQKQESIKMQAGEAARVRTPWNDADGNPVYETYHVDTTQYKAVTKALDYSTRMQSELDEASKPFMAILYKMDENDSNMSGVFQIMHQQSGQVYDSIKRSIPQEESSTAADRLRSTLPSGERWDRAVSDQTPLIKNLLGLTQDERLTLHQVNAIRDLFAPGGLLDQAYNAYRNQDWVTLNKVTKAAVRRFRSKALSSIPKDGRATLHTISRITENLQKYAAERGKQAEELNKMATGHYRGARMSTGKYRKSLAYLTQETAKAHQQFLKTAIQNPPDVWRNTAMDAVTNKISQSEKTAAAMEDTHKALSAQGWADSELTKIRQDPRTIMEIMTNAAKGSLENSMLPDIDQGEFLAATQSMYDELASLRARGQAPLYVPSITTFDVDHGLSPTYDVHVTGVKPRKPSSSFSRVWGYTPTIYDLGAGMLKATKEMVEKDITTQFINQELMPRLSPAEDVQAIVRNYYSSELANLATDAAKGAPRTETALSVINRGIEKMGLESFDPSTFFGEGFSHPGLDKPYYIDSNLASAFKQSINKFQFPAQSIVDRGTQVFRFSILGLSPRYTAHILLGGSFLVALRGHVGMAKYAGDAMHFAVHGSFSDKIVARYPHSDELYGGSSTQEGAAQATYHYVAMKSAGTHWLLPEWMSKHLLNDTYKNRLTAAADINFRFTRAITRFQKALVYLDGAARASKDGSTFYADEQIPRTDSSGNPVHHPVTGKRMTDTVRSEVPMTPQQSHNEGMEAVASVMGDLRHMTPLERSLLLRVFPFYGWTKHILQYVMSYPFDHPYRAMILSNLATMDSEDTASGLPLRIQLLTFLGTPDANGQVTAIDTKSLNPLRDTANYASLTGLFESLNPAITGPLSLVDPDISYGGQNLYPNVTFDTLYGTKTSGAGGNAVTAAEQFVPQLSALDQAFNLSGQYADLAKSGNGEFSKKLFESLGLPLTPENLNLRQEAAQSEIDRYQIAANAGYEAATDPSSNALAGYAPNAEIPDPLNTEYNVTPAYINAMNQESEDKTGLPFYQTATPPPSIPGL